MLLLCPSPQSSDEVWTNSWKRYCYVRWYSKKWRTRFVVILKWKERPSLVEFRFSVCRFFFIIKCLINFKNCLTSLNICVTFAVLLLTHSFSYLCLFYSEDSLLFWKEFFLELPLCFLNKHMQQRVRAKYNVISPLALTTPLKSEVCLHLVLISTGCSFIK